MKKDELKDYLSFHCLGKTHAVSGERLQRAVHISEKELRKQVNLLRREGVPIASGQSGYYYAATAGEVYGTIRYLKKLRAGLDAAIAGMEATLDSFHGRTCP